MDLGYSLPKTLVSGSVCGNTSPSRGQIALSTADSEEGKKQLFRAVAVLSQEHTVAHTSTVGVRNTALLSAVTNLFLRKGTGPRGVARAGLDALHALLVSFAFGRAVRELEAQLEYERVRREKLESQLDDYRAEISHLRESLEKTRVLPALPPVSAA